MMKKKIIVVDMRILLSMAEFIENRRGGLMEQLKGMSAAEVLKKTGQQNSIPVNLSQILHKLNISAIAIDFSDIEKMMPNEVEKHGPILGAVLTSGEGQTTIFYSSDMNLMSDHRYRFTVAHELGHCATTGCTNHVEFRHHSFVNDEYERAANIFAGELLIPLPQLEHVSKQLYLPTPKNLAAVFEVSESVMSARLQYLNRTDLYI